MRLTIDGRLPASISANASLDIPWGLAAATGAAARPLPPRPLLSSPAAPAARSTSATSDDIRDVYPGAVELQRSGVHSAAIGAPNRSSSNEPVLLCQALHAGENVTEVAGTRSFSSNKDS